MKLTINILSEQIQDLKEEIDILRSESKGLKSDLLFLYKEVKQLKEIYNQSGKTCLPNKSK